MPSPLVLASRVPSADPWRHGGRGSLDGGISEISGNLNDLLNDVDLDALMEDNSPLPAPAEAAAAPPPTGWTAAPQKPPNTGSSRFTSRFMTLNPEGAPQSGAGSPGNYSLFM